MHTLLQLFLTKAHTMTHKYNVRDTITMCNTPRTGSVAEGGGDYRARPEVEPTGSSVKGAHLLHTHVQYRIRSGRWGKLPGSSRGGTHWKLGEGSLQAERDEVPRGTHFNPSCKPSGTKSLEAHISIVSFAYFSSAFTQETQCRQYYGGSGGCYRARPEAEPTEAIYTHVHIMLLFAFQSRASTLEHKPP